MEKQSSNMEIKLLTEEQLEQVTGGETIMWRELFDFAQMLIGKVID